MFITKSIKEKNLSRKYRRFTTSSLSKLKNRTCLKKIERNLKHTLHNANFI